MLAGMLASNVLHTCTCMVAQEPGWHNCRINPGKGVWAEIFSVYSTYSES